MSKNWVSDRKKDYYYRLAKDENYRSRAAYKLMQIDERFSIFRNGDTVIDLGANPGGWSQVASELVGEKGRVIALDIKPLDPISGVVTIKGDARSVAVKSQVKRELLDGFANVVISDMAPNISGNYSFDHARSIELAEMALSYCDMFLVRGGNMVIKVFDGDMAHEFFGRIKDKFATAKRYSPKASRKTSSEVYMIGKGM
ncbi:MAG: RlmE family RNA methyltransferase, partial [Candidatus Thermoplasmatota archaeon]|nr:RlmE family RNA methyltransferase [Candidatus Thermoplasmatota archaeon]